jgi:predicted nucleic acid-binding protein
MKEVQGGQVRVLYSLSWLGGSDRQAFLELLRTEAILLPNEPAPGVCRDPDDDYLLGCAAAGGVEYVATGDGDLPAVRRYRDVTIVDARTFLAVLPTQRD